MSTQLQAQIKAAAMASSAFTQTGMLQRKCACGQHTVAGEECAECRQKREATLERAAVNPASVEAVPPIVRDVLGSPGQPLDAAARAFMEPRFDQDFSRVRVHTDMRATESARSINALAYTVGRDIVFGAGQYAPKTPVGRWVLAHELTHVIQQGSRDVADDVRIEWGASDIHEQQANSIATAVEGETFSKPVHVDYSQPDPSIMFLKPDEFRAQLGATPEQKSAIDTLFANTTFLTLWNYLNACAATPKQDLGPLALKVTPGLSIGGVERFGGYFGLTRTLEINPTKPEHKSNPTELVDTIVHEMIHAVFDLQSDCAAAGSPPAPLAGAATMPFTTRADVAGNPAEEAKLMKERGPGASDPCEEFIDINAAAQHMIIQILSENIQISGVGRPTLTFVNEILRRSPTAMTEYETCRGAACAIANAATRKKEVARCSANIIGKFMPPDLVPSLLPTKVYFDTDSSSLRSDSLDTLDLLALFLVAHPAIVVDLIGNTDPRGTDDENNKLGQRRADAVAKHLHDKGVVPGQIRNVISHGEKNLLSTGPDTYWKDRRVEVIPVAGVAGP
jgi:outer membrane protein OmpA-like peptidoglycan-associated protein